jgi:hypothetical protein
VWPQHLVVGSLGHVYTIPKNGFATFGPAPLGVARDLIRLTATSQMSEKSPVKSQLRTAQITFYCTITFCPFLLRLGGIAAGLSGCFRFLLPRCSSCCLLLAAAGKPCGPAYA